jgi:hypothetical protein
MPANHRVGLDDDECVCPAGPDLGEANPECAVSQAQTWWRCGSVEGGKLLAQSKVLESELGTGAEGGAKAGEQVQEQGEHGWVAHDAIARLPFLWIHAHRRETRLVDEDVAKDRISSIPRADVQDDHIKILEPMLTPGRHRVPNTAAYEVETSIAGGSLMAIIRGPQGPFIRMWVVLDCRELALAVPPRVLDIALPACVVEVLGELPYDPSVGWLRDLEVTLAWAWVQQNEQWTASTTTDSGGVPIGQGFPTSSGCHNPRREEHVPSSQMMLTSGAPRLVVSGQDLRGQTTG